MIKDTLNRPIRDLRISVTDRCNFRCSYCMPEDIFGHKYQFLTRDKILSFEEMVRLVKIYVKLGVEKIRITGGEPLLRHELEKLIAMISEIGGITDIALTTNGYFLEQKAESLKQAGLERLTISLDTLDPVKFKKMAGKHLDLLRVMAGIQKASELGLTPIKINSVIQKDINDDEILDLVTFAKERGFIIRFIEYMDVGTLNGWRMDDVVTAREMIEIISSKFAIEPLGKNYSSEVANRYRFRDGAGEIGIIASVTQPFCGSCTRVRLSADGTIYTCLFASDGMDIKTPLRAGATDEDIIARLTNMWQNRTDRYSEERSTDTVREKSKVEMYHIGG